MWKHENLLFRRIRVSHPHQDGASDKTMSILHVTTALLFVLRVFSFALRETAPTVRANDGIQHSDTIITVEVRRFACYFIKAITVLGFHYRPLLRRAVCQVFYFLRLGPFERGRMQLWIH